MLLTGSVQGVGLRPWLWRTARELGLRGSVRNVAEGVSVEVFGPDHALDSLREALADPPLPGARVDRIEERPLAAEEPSGFEIVASAAAQPGEPGAVSLAPDLPPCEACLAELADPTSRRHRHAFIACAHCGPRYTMARALPYDRARTSMAAFPLCPECEAEYEEPADRRFHAEATSCPACGPRLRLLSSAGAELAGPDTALSRAVQVLAAGGLLAVQGLGGFHLACDACDERAIAWLRQKKGRPRKPLAVMLASIAEAEKHALVSAAERELLGSEERPVVLLRRRSDSPLALGLAPGTPLIGGMLAYTPLHRLLLAEFGGPLVMTSANLSGEPIAYRLEASQADLARMADALLVHDREIVTPCDDSVAVLAASGPILLRRSRGCVPRPIRLARPLRHTVLACGGDSSNTICVASGDRAWLSAHVGDIETPASAERLEQTVQRWLCWLGLAPDVVAHDLHPGYETTRYARAFPGVKAVGVQHHHAHLASVVAEHGHSGPALGLVWDGTGYGGDGTAWGGELLLADASTCERLATFRPIALAGGEQAIREPWRLALALLDDAFDGAPPLASLGLFRAVGMEACERVRRLLAARDLCPPAHGVGRAFDAIGALLLERPVATFQGELAQGLGALASGRASVPYRFEFDMHTSPWTLDLRAAVRAITADLASRRPASQIADRFHATLVAAGGALARAGLRAARDCGRLPRDARPTLVLAGGCFQNPLLTDGLEQSLAREMQVLRPRQLPPGDGGLSLGQALVADAVVRAGREG